MSTPSPGSGSGGSNLPQPRPSQPPATTPPSNPPSTPTGGGKAPVPRPSNPPSSTKPSQPPATGQPGGSPAAPFDPTGSWSPPQQTGVLEVDPENLWAAAKKMTSLRDDFITACNGYAHSLAGTANMAGEDYVGIYFASLYDPLAHDVMTAIGDLMNSVGGVVEGLITSANTYAAADHASTHGATGAPQSVPVPAYGPESFARPAPATLYGYQDLLSWSSNPARTALFQPLKDPLAALTAWYPKGHQNLLIAAAAAWRGIDASIVSLAQSLNAVLTGLTIDYSVVKTPRGGAYPGLVARPQVDQWHAAMKKFCDKIWGSAPWDGKGLPDHPLGLAAVCAEKLASMCDAHRSAIDTTRSAIENRVADSVLATVIGAILSEVTLGISDYLAETFDEDMIMDCIDILITSYYQPIEQIELTWNLETARSSLEQAVRVAPTIQYMEAQAESVGARSLHDFGYPGMKAPPVGGKFSTKQYSGWGDPSTMGPYPISLVGQEGTGKSHVLTMHTGLTDAQLLSRVNGKDLSNPANGSSGFSNASSAQTLVQGDINSPANQQKIAAWLTGPHTGPVSQDQLTINDPGSSATTGRIVVDQNGTHQVVNAHGVRAVLKYNPNLDPPFYVYTAFPTQ